MPTWESVPSVSSSADPEFRSAFVPGVSNTAIPPRGISPLKVFPALRPRKLNDFNAPLSARSTSRYLRVAVSRFTNVMVVFQFVPSTIWGMVA